MAGTRILLARHGETDWNRERRWQGHADPPLNELGRAQAVELAERLRARPFVAIYSSDLQRARDTAARVAQEHGLDVITDPRLREVDVGEWSGLTSEEIAHRFPEGVRRRAAGGTGWSGGETLEEMGARVRTALLEIAARHRGELVLVVTHGGVMRSVWSAATGRPSHDAPRYGNADTAEYEAGESGIRPIHS